MQRKEMNVYFTLTQSKQGEIVFESTDTVFIARIYLLCSDIVRVLLYKKDEEATLENTWWVVYGNSDVSAEGNARLVVDRSLLTTAYDITEDAQYFYIHTQNYDINIEKRNFILSWSCNGDTFLQDRPTQAYNLGYWDDNIYHYVCRQEGDMYFGCGEKTGHMNKYGKRYTMNNLDPMGYDASCTDPLYKHYPFYITYKRDIEYFFGIFYDNFSTSYFNFGQEHDNYHVPYTYFKSEGGYCDYYVCMGASIQKVVKNVTWLTGKVIFPPKWSLGYSGSTMNVTDSPNAQTLLYTFLENCKKYDIPCDSFQLSSGYTSIDNKRYVFHWNREKFPDPRKLCEDFLQNDIRFCANIKPCLLTSHPRYNECEDIFVHTKDGKISTSQFWDEEGSYIDFTNEHARTWWKNNVREQLLSYGIVATWNDNNEFQIWDNSIVFKGTKHDNSKVLQTLLMVKASFEAQKEFDDKTRPYLISRSGCPGLQRYAQTWTGDNYTSFKTLEYNVYMGLGLSLSGMYNIGHDVGGFSGDPPSEELLTRWVQHGIFYPRFTIHSWNNDGSTTTPWMYEHTVDTIRHAIHLRYALMPYLYDLLYKAHTSYEPIIRPLFYNYEKDPYCFKETTDFMVGEHILVSNVMKEGEKIHTTYLPSGEQWYSFHAHTCYAGGQHISYAVDIESIPFFVRAGTVLAMNDGISVSNKQGTSRTFIVYPPSKGKRKNTYFEDDGYSYDYLQGQYIQWEFEVLSHNNTIEIIVNLHGRKNTILHIASNNIISMNTEVFFKVINHENKHIQFSTNISNVVFEACKNEGVTNIYILKVQ